jgi:hypothetical protein
MTPKAKKQSPLENYFSDLHSANDSPRFQIVVTNGVLEMLVNALIENKCKNAGKMEKWNYGVKLILLNEMGILSDKFFTLLDEFRRLRNQAAHGHFKLTAEMLIKFVDVKMNTVMEDPKTPADFLDLYNFKHLCNLLFVGFWHEHLDVFKNAFEKMDMV